MYPDYYTHPCCYFIMFHKSTALSAEAFSLLVNQHMVEATKKGVVGPVFESAQLDFESAPVLALRIVFNPQLR